MPLAEMLTPITEDIEQLKITSNQQVETIKTMYVLMEQMSEEIDENSKNSKLNRIIFFVWLLALTIYVLLK